MKFIVEFVVMQERHGESSPFNQLNRIPHISQESAEAAIERFIQRADPLTGTPDLWIRKTYKGR